MFKFDPKDWYYELREDTLRVFSTSRGVFVAVDDPTYATWAAAGNTAVPVDSADEIYAALTTFGVPPYASVSPRQARLALLAAGLLDQRTRQLMQRAARPKSHGNTVLKSSQRPAYCVNRCCTRPYDRAS